MKKNKYYISDSNMVVFISEDWGYIRTMEFRNGQLIDETYTLKDKEDLFGTSYYQEISLEEFIDEMDQLQLAITNAIDDLSFQKNELDDFTRQVLHKKNK